jgi:hypothetical protein
LFLLSFFSVNRMSEIRQRRLCDMSQGGREPEPCCVGGPERVIAASTGVFDVDVRRWFEHSHISRVCCHAIPTAQRRHARTCCGHPRLLVSRRKGVDGRNKSGHDDLLLRVAFFARLAKCQP